MNVLVLAQLFPPDMGGGGTRAYNVVSGLISLGHTVTVVTAFPHYPTGNIPKEYRHRLLAIERSGKLRIVRTWIAPAASKGSMRRLLLIGSFAISSLFALPLVGRVNVIWAANPNVFSVFPALFYRALKHSPIVQNVDDLWPEEVYDLNMLKSGLLRKTAEFISRFTYVTSSAITPISPAYADVIVKRYGISPGKLHVVYAGVDLRKFKRQRNCAKDLKGPRQFKVLYIGALSPTYNFDQMLEAARFLSSNRDIKFMIQGGGELGPTLRSKIEKMKLSNITIKLQIVGRDKVPRLLSEADVLILPLSGLESVEMGISSKLYEYQASGKPVICCSRGQHAQYVSKTKSGIVVSPGDSRGLAKAILYLYRNRDICKSLGSEGRNYVKNNLSSKKIASQMVDVFSSLLTKTQSP